MTKSNIAVIALISFLLVGCASSTSRVFFAEPEGTRLEILPSGPGLSSKKTVVFPERISLQQSRGHREISMLLPDGTKLEGYLYVFPKMTSHVEELAEVSFRLTREQAAKLRKGHAVTVEGISAERKRVYRIILGLDRQ